jgi:hypothetical protein
VLRRGTFSNSKLQRLKTDCNEIKDCVFSGSLLREIEIKKDTIINEKAFYGTLC